MLARNPLALAACWQELSPGNHHYIVGGETLGLVCKVGHSFYAEADRATALGRQNGQVMRLGRFASMLAGMTAVQDALAAPTAIATDPPIESDDEHLRTAFDVLGHRWLA